MRRRFHGRKWGKANAVDHDLFVPKLSLNQRLWVERMFFSGKWESEVESLLRAVCIYVGMG